MFFFGFKLIGICYCVVSFFFFSMFVDMFCGVKGDLIELESIDICKKIVCDCCLNVYIFVFC